MEREKKRKEEEERRKKQEEEERKLYVISTDLKHLFKPWAKNIYSFDSQANTIKI